LILAIAAAAAVAFLAGLAFSGLVPAAMTAIRISNAAMRTIRDPVLDDEAKEKLVQRAALDLLVASLSIAIRVAAALCLPALVVFFAELAGLAGQAEVYTLMLTWEFIIGSTVVLTLFVFAWRRFWKR
jgi:hypothetical protein